MQSLDFSHLKMMVFSLDLPLSVEGQVKKKARVEVVFTCHCYSREIEQGESVDPNHIVQDGARSRVFCRERYDYSLSLPEKMMGLLEGNAEVFRTVKANFFSVYLCEIDESGNSLVIPYTVFMEADKKQEPNKPQKIVIHIKSAHLRRKKAQPTPVGAPTKVLNLLGEVWEHGKQLRRAQRKKPSK